MPIEPIWGYQGILHESEGFMRDWHNRANIGILLVFGLITHFSEIVIVFTLIKERLKGQTGFQ